MTGLSTVYYGLPSAAADGELHLKELEANHAFVNKLNITVEQVQQARALIDEEGSLRQKRVKVLYPKSLEETLNEFYKYHQ